MDIKVPSDLWEDDAQAVITTWFVSDGGNVSQGTLIAEIMVEKTQFEIHAPGSGSLSISQPVETVVSKGSVIGEIS